jgi:repressor LexA
MLELTRRQTEILNLIRKQIEKTGLPPTRAEICEMFGFSSPNAAEQHLRALENKGAIEIVPGISRGIRLISQGTLTTEFSLPVVGQVAAGQTILSVEHIDVHYRVDPGLFKPRADYLLRVRGQSMRDAGILGGDLLAVRRARTAANGQIVVARLEDEVTVKRLEVKGHKARLLPANPDFEPIVLDLRRQPLSIEGLGVGVIRRL